MTELSEYFVSRAITAGFDGIVVTLDCGTLGWRPGDLEKAAVPMHDGRMTVRNAGRGPRFCSAWKTR